jgi:hypothetical protein
LAGGDGPAAEGAAGRRRLQTKIATRLVVIYGVLGIQPFILTYCLEYAKMFTTNILNLFNFVPTALEREKKMNKGKTTVEYVFAVNTELLTAGDMVTIVSALDLTYIVEIVDPIASKVLVSSNRYNSLPATLSAKVLEVGRRSSFIDEEDGQFGIITVARLSLN